MIAIRQRASLAAFKTCQTASRRGRIQVVRAQRLLQSDGSAGRLKAEAKVDDLRKGVGDSLPSPRCREGTRMKRSLTR